jgi:hypothetical protein
MINVCSLPSGVVPSDGPAAMASISSASMVEKDPTTFYTLFRVFSIKVMIAM